MLGSLHAVELPRISQCGYSHLWLSPKHLSFAVLMQRVGNQKRNIVAKQAMVTRNLLGSLAEKYAIKFHVCMGVSMGV